MNNIEVLAQEQKKEASPLWQEPVHFDEYKLPTFNVDVFPRWLREYIQGVSESTQTPIDAACMAAISILSTILSKKFSVNITEDWSESLNTYAVLALPPGNRKSSVFKLMQLPIITYEREERERLEIEIIEQKAILKAKQKRIEGLEKDYAKNGEESILNEIRALTNEIEKEKLLISPRYITGDVTAEKLGVLLSENNEKIALLSAEGGGAFNNMAGRYSSDGKANIDIYLNGHTGDYTTVDRIGRDPIILNEPCLSIGLFVQPEVLRDVPSTFKERGLMQRFLYSLPKSLVGYRKVNPDPVCEEIKNSYLTNIKNLLQFEPNEPIKLTFDSEAVIHEQRLRQDIEDMLKEGGTLSDMKGWGSKLAGQIIRIAGLLHVVEYIPGKIKAIPTQIKTTTLASAKNLMYYFIEHARAAFGVMEADRRAEDGKYLLGVIKRLNKPVVEYRELQMQTRKRFKKAYQLKMVISDLHERGFIIPKMDGRKTLYEVNPLIVITEYTHNTHNSI